MSDHDNLQEITKRTRKLRETTPNDQIIRPRNLPQVTGLSKTSIWRLERAGDFPKRIKLSAGAVGYKRAEVEAWLESRNTVNGG